MFGSVYHSGVGYFPSAPLHNIPSRLTFEPEEYDESLLRGPEANRWLREEYAEWRKEERVREAKRRGFTSLEAMQQWDMLEFQRDAADRREFYRKLREEQSAPPISPEQPAVKNSEPKHDPPLNGALMCARGHKSGKWCVLPRGHKGMHRTSGTKEEPIYWQDKDRVKNQQNDQTRIPLPNIGRYWGSLSQEEQAVLPTGTVLGSPKGSNYSPLTRVADGWLTENGDALGPITPSSDRPILSYPDHCSFVTPDRSVYPHTTARRAGRTALCRCGQIAFTDGETWGDDCPIAMRATLATIHGDTLEKAAKACEKLAMDYARKAGDNDRLDALEAAAYVIRDLKERDPAGDGT